MTKQACSHNLMEQMTFCGYCGVRLRESSPLESLLDHVTGRVKALVKREEEYRNPVFPDKTNPEVIAQRTPWHTKKADAAKAQLVKWQAWQEALEEALRKSEAE